MANLRTAVRAGWLLGLSLACAAPVAAGGLSFLGFTQNGTAGVEGLGGVSALAVSPDGAFVYAAGTDDDAVAVLARDPVTGALAFVAAARDGIGGVQGMRVPVAVALSPNGASLYVASREEDALVVFDRDAGTGALTFRQVVRDGVSGADGIDHASGVAVSPDGAHVYATGEHDDAVAAFARDLVTGALTFVEVQRDGVGGVAGIQRPSAVTMSPDGANVYVAGGADDDLAVFARNAATGALTFLEEERYGEGGHGIDRPNSVVVTADGASLYVAGHDDDGVAAFARDGATGRLTFVETEDNHGAMSGLEGSFGVAAAPDGRYVFAVGENDHTVSTLRRDATTSGLTFVEAARDGRLGVDGLRKASAVAMSPDGLHAYVAGHDDDAVAAFAVDRCGNAGLGADEQCDDGNLAAGDGCSATCRLERCGPTPAIGCRTPIVADAASLAIVRKGADRRHALDWRWNQGPATTLAEFGLPTTTDAYLLCVYDGSAAPQPLLALAAPPDDDCFGVPCWDAANSGFVYKDRLRTPDGVQLVRLRAGAEDGTAAIAVTGRGASLALPALPLTTPVVVQLANVATGACWQATYDAPSVNDGERFRATGE